MSKWTRVASRLATVIVLVLFVLYAVNNRDSFTSLLMVSWTTLLFVATGRMMIFVSNGLFVKWTAEAFTRQLSVGEGVYVGILSAIGNFFGPLLGGAGVRAVYLRRVHDLPYTKFTSTLMVYYVILFGLAFASAIVGLLTLDLVEPPYFLLAVFSGGLLLLGTATMLRLPARLRTQEVQGPKIIRRVLRYLFDIEDGWRRLLSLPRLMVQLVGLAVLSVAAQFLIAFVSFSAIGAQVSWAALAVYVAIVVISILVAFTPGAIGIRETMLLLVSETLGMTGNQIIEVAVIDRGVMFALLLGLFVVTRNSRLRQSLTTRDLPV